MPDNQQHPWETTGDNVAQWLDTMSTRLAQRMMVNGRPPFAAPTTEADKLRYYNTPQYDGQGNVINFPLYNADGTPNEANRAALINRVGAQRYASAIRRIVDLKTKAAQGMILDQADAQDATDTEKTAALPTPTDPYA